MFKRVSACSWLAIVPILLVGARADTLEGRLATVSEFRNLPADIATDLTNRGCRIPQVKGVPGLQNVLQGQFREQGKRDWAVLCLAGNVSTILVYWNGSSKDPASLAPMDETIKPLKNGYFRILRTVGAKFIRSHADDAATDGDRVPSALDHEGIDDGIFEKGSLVHYFYNGKWLSLSGSD